MTAVLMHPKPRKSVYRVVALNGTGRIIKSTLKEGDFEQMFHYGRRLAKQHSVPFVLRNP